MRKVLSSWSGMISSSTLLSSARRWKVKSPFVTVMSFTTSSKGLSSPGFAASGLAPAAGAASPFAGFLSFAAMSSCAKARAATLAISASATTRAVEILDVRVMWFSLEVPEPPFVSEGWTGNAIGALAGPRTMGDRRGSFPHRREAEQGRARRPARRNLRPPRWKPGHREPARDAWARVAGRKRLRAGAFGSRPRRCRDAERPRSPRRRSRRRHPGRQEPSSSPGSR